MSAEFPGASYDAWKEREPDPHPDEQDATASDEQGWQLVHDVAYERVRRMAIPGGWLYQTEIDELHEVLRVGEDSTRVSGWHPPVFVPNPAVRP